MKINVENLSISFDEKSILKGISCEIFQGDFLSIIGPNGAGKSTILKCICGLIDGWSGSISIDEKPLKNFAPKERAKLISYVPQSVQNRLPFSVFEFVAMGRYPHLSPFSSLDKSDRDLIENALKSVQMQNFRDRKMDTLSGGERQMVMIAAGLAQGGNALILDEPINFWLSPQVEVMQTLKNLNETQNLSIVTVNHDLQSALNFSSKLIAIKNGKLFRAGTPLEFADADFLKDLYETNFQKISIDNRNFIFPEGLLNEPQI